jgi:hypothetical protein
MPDNNSRLCVVLHELLSKLSSLPSRAIYTVLPNGARLTPPPAGGAGGIGNEVGGAGPDGGRGAAPAYAMGSPVAWSRDMT